MTFKPAAPNRLQIPIIWLLSLATSKSIFITKNLKAIGDVADFQQWVKLNFPESKLLLRREKIWENVLKNSLRPKRIVELGVAWGYMTNWFLRKSVLLGRKSNKKIEIKIDSFDLFTGLPESWRYNQKNTFSNKGTIPDINDDRVKFHVGDVEETIKNLNLNDLRQEELVVMFDLDLHKPSLFCYLHLKPALKVGDILYFDEAFDIAERTIIEKYVFQDFICESLGHSGFAICLRIIEIIKNHETRKLDFIDH